MTAEDLIARAISVRTAQGLSVEATGIEGRPDTYVRHFTNTADRDAYIERCTARGETVRILNGARLMAKSTAIYRDIALLALNADEGRWTESGTLEAVASYCWQQLLYRRGPAELEAMLAEFAEDLGEEA